MTKVKACKKCHVSLEANAISKEDNSKIPLQLLKCPLCGGELVDDDSENYED